MRPCRYSRGVRLTLGLAIAIPGLVLLGTPLLPLGLIMVVAGWWVYERSGLPSGDGLITFLMVMGGLGALMQYVQAAWEALARL